MTDHATPANREATQTPDGRTIDLLIDCYEALTSWSQFDPRQGNYPNFDGGHALALERTIRSHLMDLARVQRLMQPEWHCVHCGSNDDQHMCAGRMNL